MINKGTAGTTVTATGSWTVTNLLTMTQGTWDAASFTHSIAGAWNSSSANFTFSAGSSTITLSSAGPSITTKGIGTDPFYNLDCSSGGSLASAVQATNNLAVSGGTLTLNGFALTVGASLTGAGTLTATGSEAIQVGANWGVTTFNSQSSTVTFAGTGSIQTATTFANLTIGAAGNTTLQANIGINAALNVTAGGILNAGTFTITMNGAQWNNAGTFNPGTGTVSFTLANAATTLSINGSNSWYNFSVTAASAYGKTIEFQHMMTQTVVAGGSFTVLGGSRRHQPTDHADH